MNVGEAWRALQRGHPAHGVCQATGASFGAPARPAGQADAAEGRALEAEGALMLAESPWAAARARRVPTRSERPPHLKGMVPGEDAREVPGDVRSRRDPQRLGPLVSLVTSRVLDGDQQPSL